MIPSDELTTSSSAMTYSERAYSSIDTKETTQRLQAQGTASKSAPETEDTLLQVSASSQQQHQQHQSNEYLVIMCEDR